MKEQAFFVCYQISRNKVWVEAHERASPPYHDDLLGDIRVYGSGFDKDEGEQLKAACQKWLNERNN